MLVTPSSGSHRIGLWLLLAHNVNFFFRRARDRIKCRRHDVTPLALTSTRFPTSSTRRSTIPEGCLIIDIVAGYATRWCVYACTRSRMYNARARANMCACVHMSVCVCSADKRVRCSRGAACLFITHYSRLLHPFLTRYVPRGTFARSIFAVDIPIRVTSSSLWLSCRAAQSSDELLYLSSRPGCIHSR